MTKLKTLVRLSNPQSRRVIFAPTGEIVARTESGNWWVFDPIRDAVHEIGVPGTHAAFFGTWFLVRDESRDRTTALRWPLDRDGSGCEIGFDVDYGFRATAITAATEATAAFVRQELLWLRQGAPGTIDDREGWDLAARDFHSNVRLLLSPTGRYVVGANAGAAIDVLDRNESKVTSHPIEVDGHPTWAAMHPVRDTVTICSRWLVTYDLVSRESKRVLWAASKPSGDYLHDGRFLFGTDFGLLLLDGNDLHHVAQLRRPVHLAEPVRVSPDGQLVVVPSNDLAVYRTEELLR